MNAKYQRVASLLERRIRQGTLSDGDKLPGEAQLARELNVSRGTVRQAIAELQRQQLISTQTGVGSFVTFDGVALDSAAGWAHALATGGRELRVDLLDITSVPGSDVPEAPSDLAGGQAIAIRRVRRLPDGTAVSFECSSVLATDALRDLPQRGLIDDSITKTLAAAGLSAVGGQQQVSVVRLPSREAGILERPAGVPFLRSVRTSRSSSGGVVEHVVSWLDPDHFRLHMTFGETA